MAIGSAQSQTVKFSGIRSVGGEVVRQIARVWRVLRNRRQVIKLLDFTDDQLLDIGLSRADVGRAFSTSSFFDDPSDMLTAAARRHMRSMRSE